MPLKPITTKKPMNGVKTTAISMQMVPKSGAITQSVKQMLPEPIQQPPLKLHEKKQSPEDMIVEILKEDKKYTRKLLKLKMMGNGVDAKSFGMAIDQLESSMKIVYIPPEVISIQEKDNAVVRLKQRVIPSKRTPI